MALDLANDGCIGSLWFLLHSHVDYEECIGNQISRRFRIGAWAICRPFPKTVCKRSRALTNELLVKADARKSKMVYSCGVRTHALTDFRPKSDALPARTQCRGEILDAIFVCAFENQHPPSDQTV